MTYLLTSLIFMLPMLQVSDTATVSVQVQGKNDFPIARDDAYSTDQDTPIDSAALGLPALLDNDTDRDRNDAIIVAEVNGVPVQSGDIVVLPSGAALTINADGTFVYNPGDAFLYLGEGEQAVDSFTYKAANP